LGESVTVYLARLATATPTLPALTLEMAMLQLASEPDSVAYLVLRFAVHTVCLFRFRPDRGKDSVFALVFALHIQQKSNVAIYHIF